MTQDIDKMTSQEIIEYLKTKNSRLAKIATVIDFQKAFKQNGIPARCPYCGSSNFIKSGKSTNGNQRYKCKLCGKRFLLTVNTIFEGFDLTWDEMVKLVYFVITKQSIEFISQNVCKTPINKQTSWLLVMKVLYILSSMPKPKLKGMIQIDEKYFRENQKGNQKLISFLDSTNSRYARRHNYRSECGIFGPEFVNVLCAVDSFGHYYAKCVCLGPLSFNELSDLENQIESVSYICTDNLELYRLWTKKHHWNHYIEPSTFRKERKARGYIDTDNIYKTLTEADYKRDRKINEQLYKEKLYPHIENTDKKINYDEFIALRYKFGLTLNGVNNFHAQLEKDIVKSKTGVASDHLPIYVGAYTFLANYKKEYHITSFTVNDAADLLVKICKFTLSNKKVPTRTDIDNLNILDLPKPSKKIINASRQKIRKARQIVVCQTTSADKSAYEGDSTSQFIFNKRKFFLSLGVVRLNELIKQYGLYEKGLTKRQKVEKMCKLPNADDIIFYEIYLHKYGSVEEFTKSIKTSPPKRKRGRPKKS